MTRSALLLLTAVSCGCADIIGLNGLGDNEASGGASTDEVSSGGTSTGGDGPSSGGAATGGATGDGGSGDGGSGDGGSGDGGSGGTTSGGGSDSGGTGGTTSGGTSGSGGANGSGAASGVGGSPYGCSWDQFTDAQFTADCWSVHNLDLAVGANGDVRNLVINEEGGVLALRPSPARTWNSGDSSFLLYQELEGDFRFEVHVWAFAGIAMEDPPQQANLAGGIVVMDADEPLSETPGVVNTDYYAVKFGTFDDAMERGYWGEYTYGPSGTTVSGLDLEYSEIWNGVYIRVCWIQGLLTMGLRRSDGEAWKPAHADGSEYGYTPGGNFPALDGALRVGLIAEFGEADAITSQLVYQDATIEYDYEFEGDCF